MLEPGSKVGRYEVVRLVGKGDLASTWRVEAEGCAYALRVLHVNDAGFAERLRRASDAQLQVDHPNLLRVIEVVEVERMPAVVTPFVEGTDLEKWIARGPHLPAEIHALFRQMAAGVAAAHQGGLLHRNLKPGKVLIGRDASGRPQVRIADFLLGKVRHGEQTGAAVTQMGTTFGTPQYMSPEQFRGAATVDERGDLFALGCLLYEMATGTRAFQGTGLIEIYTAVARCEIRPLEEVRPGLPPWIGEVIGRLLRPNPADRIASGAELVALVDAAGATSAPDLPVPADLQRAAPEPRELTEPGPELEPVSEPEVEITDVKGPDPRDGHGLQPVPAAPLSRSVVMMIWLAILAGLGIGIVVALGALVLLIVLL